MASTDLLCCFPNFLRTFPLQGVNYSVARHVLMHLLSLFRFYSAVCAALLCLPATTALHAEWGFEGALGANPTAYYGENLRKNNSPYQSEISGRRHTLSFAGKLHFEWVGLRLLADYYFAGSGKQKTQTSVQTAPNQGFSQQTTEQDGVAYSSAQSYRAELQLRKFYYGHREIFAFNSGLVYRRMVTDLTGQSSDYAAQSILYRYFTLGFTFEPLLTNFGRYELSLPIDFSLGLKFPEGGIFQGGGPGSVLFAAGLRLQQEPRGFFLVTQGMFSFFETPYSANGADYAFGQTEVTVRLMAGYYFRKPLYNE